MKTLLLFFFLTTAVQASTITTFKKIQNMTSGQSTLSWVNHGSIQLNGEQWISIVQEGVCCGRCLQSQQEQQQQMTSMSDEGVYLNQNQAAEYRDTLYICQ